MPHNVTGRSGVNGTNTNVVITNRMLTTEPLEMTQSLFTDPIVLSLKGITGFTGSGGNVLKSNSANNALEWGVDNNEIIGVSLPLQKVGSTISLIGLSTLDNSNANKIIKVNSAGTALIYDNDDGSNWILSNNNLYPLSTGTNLVVGSTINSSTTRKLFVNGTADINGELFFNGDDETYIDADSKSLRNYAGYVAGSIGGQHKFYVKQSSSTDLVASLRTGALTLYGESNMNSGLSKLELIASGSQQFRIVNNNGGGSTPNISFESETVGNTIDPYYYSFTFDSSERYRFTKNGGISIGEWKATAIGALYGGTGLSSLTPNKILQINSAGTGFNQVSIPVVNTYTAGTLINVSASNVISFTGTIPVYTAGTLISVNSNIISFTGTIPTNNNTLTNGAGYITASSIPVPIWGLYGTTISPANNSNMTIQIAGASSKVIGTITNVVNSAVPLVRFGGFQDLYTTDTFVSNLYVENKTGTYRNVKLTCNSAFDRLEINKNTKITGGLDATTSISCDKFSAQNTTSNYFESNSSYGFGLYGITSGRQLSIRGATSSFPFIGSTSTEDFVIHINNFGDAYEITTPSSGGQTDIQHNFYGEFQAVFGHFAIKRGGDYQYFYNPNGTHSAEGGGSASHNGSYYAYHDNGSYLNFNLPNAGTGTGSYISFSTGGSQKMRIVSNGTLYVCGTVYDNNCPSDSRLKHNQKVYDKNATDILNKIVVKDFKKAFVMNFNDNDPNNTESGMKPFSERLCPMEDCKYDIGIIAQEIYEIPELSFIVDTEGWGEELPATIPDWNPLISLLIKSNQEQQVEIDTLKTELNAIKELLLKNNIV